MSKFKNKYFISVIVFYIFWLGILPLLISNTVRVICKNFSYNSNYEITISNPKTMLYFTPVIKFETENLSVKNKITQELVSVENFKLKLRILPLICKKFHINEIGAENFKIKKEIKKGDVLNKNFFENLKNANIICNSAYINNFETIFYTKDSQSPIIYRGKYFNFNHKNRYNSLKIDSTLQMQDKNSVINTDLYLPKNGDINKTNFDIDISNLDIEPIGEFFKNFMPENIKKIQGIINISADKEGLKVLFTNTEIIMTDRDLSVKFPNGMTITSKFNINKNLITINSAEMIADNLSLKFQGKIRDYFGNTMPTVDLNLVINKSKIEDFIEMLPPFKVEELDVYKLKKYKFYGNILGNISIKGRFPEPDIIGSIFINDGILIKPIPNTNNGAVIKLSFTGKHAGYDISVPAGKGQKVWVKGTQEIYNVKYADMTVKSTKEVNLKYAEDVVNPLHEILNFIIGPVPIMKITGTGNIDITVKGNRTNPHVWGGLNFYNTNAKFIDIPDLELTNANAALTFNDKNAKFELLKGLVNNKDFKLNGTCDLEGKFNFSAQSLNQPTKALYQAIMTSKMLDELRKNIPSISNITGTSNLDLKIYGTIKDIEGLAFNKNLFVKGLVETKNNNFDFEGQKITNVNALILQDGLSTQADIKASIDKSPLDISAKIKNNVGDLIIKIPILNPNFIFDNKNSQETEYLPLISLDAKYKGNLSNIDYSKLNFTAKVLPNNTKSFIKCKTGLFTLNNNKLTIKNLDGYINNPQNSIKADLQISNALSENPIFDGFAWLKLADITVLNNLFGEKILPDKINDYLKDIEFERGTINILAKFNAGNLLMDSDISGIKFNYLPIEMPVELINGKLSIKNNNIKFNKLNILADKMPILVDGEIQDFTNKQKFNIYINSKPKQDFIDKFINKNRIYPLKIKGDILYSAKIRGVPNNYDIKAKANLNKDSYIYYYGATVGDIENGIVINLDSKIIDKKTIKIKEFLYNKLIDSQNGKFTDLNMLKVQGGIKILDNDFEFKDLAIKTLNPTDARIFNLLFGKPNIKQGQFTSDLKMNGKLSNPKILGDFHIVETNIPFLDTTMKNIELSFKEKSIELVSKGEVLGNNVSAGAVLKNKLTPPYYIESGYIYTKDMDLNRIVNKIKSAETEDNHNQDTLANFDIKSIVAQNIKLKADNLVLRNIHASDFEANVSLNNSCIFEMKDFIFNIAKGSLGGTYSYNLKNNDIKLNMSADKISANDITLAIFDLHNQIYGDMTGTMDLSCNGETFENCMKTLNGNAVFSVNNGRMPKLGSLEYLLKAGNLVKGGITNISINSVIDLISPMKTGEFSEIYGSIYILNGVAKDFEITTQGKDLSLFIGGTYKFAEAYADMEVIGMLSRKISTMFGPIGNMSVNTLFNVIPGIDLSKDTNLREKINRIPGLELSDKAYRKFLAIIKGNINGEDYVKSFKWIN